jgi:hypothetical protein
MSNEPLTTLAASWALIEVQFLMAGIAKQEIRTARQIFYTGATAVMAVLKEGNVCSLMDEIGDWIEAQGVSHE